LILTFVLILILILMFKFEVRIHHVSVSEYTCTDFRMGERKE